MWNPRMGKSGMAAVRAVHNVANGPNVDVLFDGVVVLSDVAYKASSDYLKVPVGNHVVSIVVGGTVLAKAHVSLVANSHHTIIAHGDVTNLSSIALLDLLDNNKCPNNGKSHIRFVHAAANVPSVDIWADDMKVFKNVAYGQTGKPTYLAVDSGVIPLSVAPAGTLDIVLGPADFAFDSKLVYTIIATGLVDDDTAPLNVITLIDTHCSTVNLRW